MILILGMPRSGTSYTCEILENLGFNFNINDNNNLNDIYKGNKNFYQHKDLHAIIYNTDAKNFKNVNNVLNLPNVEIIKEPYLLFFLEAIKDKIHKIILNIRNPYENILSIKNFININGGAESKHFGYKEWNLYYINFLQIINRINIPFIVLNYNNLKCNYDCEIDKLKSFLGIEKCLEEKIIFKNNNCEDLININPLSKYIYLNLTSNNRYKFFEILHNYKIVEKIKPNDICFCNSGKKYKKCCK